MKKENLFKNYKEEPRLIIQTIVATFLLILGIMCFGSFVIGITNDIQEQYLDKRYNAEISETAQKIMDEYDGEIYEGLQIEKTFYTITVDRIEENFAVLEIFNKCENEPYDIIMIDYEIK